MALRARLAAAPALDVAAAWPVVGKGLVVLRGHYSVGTTVTCLAGAALLPAARVGGALHAAPAVGNVAGVWCAAARRKREHGRVLRGEKQCLWGGARSRHPQWPWSWRLTLPSFYVMHDASEGSHSAVAHDARGDVKGEMFRARLTLNSNIIPTFPLRHGHTRASEQTALSWVSICRDEGREFVVARSAHPCDAPVQQPCCCVHGASPPPHRQRVGLLWCAAPLGVPVAADDGGRVHDVRGCVHPSKSCV